MRFDEETNTAHKCIHEALDYDWCDCSDETRAELNVSLPKPDPICDSCPDPAFFVLQMTDSISMDNLFFSCRQCAQDILGDWIWGDSHYSQVEGWEVRKIDSSRTPELRLL